MSVSAKAGPWLELIPFDAVTFAAMHMSAFGGKADITRTCTDVCF